MNLIMLGPPGAGKGTQAKFIAAKLNIPHISTGDIFRYNINENTTLGIEAKLYIDKGHLVPDDVTNRMVEERASRQDCKNGFLFDGYPRTVKQAEFLKALLNKKNEDIDVVIEVELKEEEILRRLTMRRVCGECNTVYHLMSNPPAEENICDKCGKELYHRSDDREEVILSRIRVYKDQTSPLADFYSKENKLVKIDGSREIKTVTENIMSAIEK